MKSILISARNGHAIKDLEARKNYFRERFQFFLKHREVLEGMVNEPWFLDDDLFQDDPEHAVERLIQYLVMQAETILYVENGEIVFAAAFVPNRPRSAEFIGWINPLWRGRGYRVAKLIVEFWCEEVLDFVWNDLQLQKFETRCCVKNERALKFAMKAGMTPVGLLRLDFQIQGELFDTVLFEALNPTLVAAPPATPEVTDDDKRESEQQSIPDGDGVERPTTASNSVELPELGVQFDPAGVDEVKYPSAANPYELHSSFRTKRYAVG